MVRIFQVKELGERKRLLIVKSDIYRQTLKLQVASAGTALAHIKAQLTALSVSSFAFKAVTEVIELFIGRTRSEGKPGFFSKVMSGVKFFGQIKNFLGRIKSSLPTDSV